MEKLYPLKFEPFLRTMVWGGSKIPAYKGIQSDIPKIGESWEISGVGEHLTAVADGPLKGKTVADLTREYKADLVGQHVYAQNGDEFPLLVKFIDALSDLSIQVHPDDRMAKEKHGPDFRGKTEMWYVIAGDPGACLYCGIKEPITREEYEQKVKDGTITDVLARYEVSPGDVFFLPAGRVHAICSGCLIAEIQQTSDLTYRIWDYNRPGLDGKPRQLHTELAKEAINYTVLPDYQTHYTPCKDQEVVLVSCQYFTTSLYELTKPIEKALPDSFLVVMCLEGSGRVGDVPIRKGETVLVPACEKRIGFTPDGEMKLVTSYVTE